MTRNERQLKAVEQEMERHGHEADEVLSKADSEDRDTEPKEKEEVESHLKAIRTLRETKADLEDAIRVEDEVRGIGRKIGTEDPEAVQVTPQPQAKTLGEQFVESKQYQSLQSADGLTGDWKTGKIDLETKATLLEGTNASPGAGGYLVPIDQRAGVLPLLYQQLTVADLMAAGSTTSNAIRYVVEATNTSGAAIVAEGGSKPESALTFSQVDEPVKKIATFLPVSDEMLEDAAQIQSYINARLTLFVRQQEEAQLLGGAGGANLTGLMPRIPVGNRYVLSTATSPNAADHIYQAITVARRSFLEPDGIVIHPDDWAALRLLKDGNDNYIGGSPFSNTGSNPGESLWGKRVVITTAINAGSALVGAFSTASQVFRRGGLTVEASNSHSDYFIKNLTAIRAEERLGLAVYRPSAFAIADIGYAS